MDCIYYRLPAENEFVHQQGQFELVKGTIPNGFVVSDFLHQRIFQFVPSVEKSTPLWHIHSDQPVVISQRDYQIEAQAMLHAFPVMGVEKAVYSRVKAVSFPIEKSEKLFHELAQTYPNACVYLISSAQFGTWIGATPETLVNTEKDQLKTIALAGTHSANDSSAWTNKEYEEHDFVVKAIAETLLRNQCAITMNDGPKVVTAGPVQHLQTDFTAKMGDTVAWQIAMDLHPTPAVCGTPRMASLDLLTSREMHDRFLYAGVIGLYSEERSRLFVNLRCAQLQQDKAFLYLGGGYTIDSIPDLEWDETENKSRTLLNCMEKV
ncbi:MAG: chorismate-binding protein [Fluviicola sp.]|nr:chorismate-binding protein [Fluviicola sp.]